MSKTTSTVELHAVARGEKILSHGFLNADHALNELTNYEASMRALDLEPDVRLVTYTETTTVETSRPRAYHHPDAAQPADPAEQGDTTQP